ncbi:MAG: nicotinate phosphoribosyltransferase [Acidobacteriia bacterium]|nr:nicotinate phosphoribosyltransferase [Terriglobia bacterium]
MPSSHNSWLPRYSGLLTDLYELTMAAGYVQNRFVARATFELFVRHLPPHRNYLVAAGLEQALDFLEHVRFSEEEISYLRALPLFGHVQSEFFDYLRKFRFTGDVWALPEGTIFFPGEPILRVTAPIAEAQLMETSLLSAIHLQTVIASKAARITTAAAGRPVIEFGSRRAHGIEAGVLAARAAFIGGCEGTSNAYAGYVFGMPVYGTQAHSWIMAHDDETVAFGNFLNVFPEQSTLLVDTYDVRAAIEKIIAMGRKPRGIRLDSGNVVSDSIWTRQRLDGIGWNDVQIFASGDLTEERIAALLAAGGRAGSFGVGTALSTSADSPTVGVIYKLVEVEFEDHVRSTAKFSPEKKTYPGRKQVFRFRGDDGILSEDVIALEDEIFPDAEPLLVQVMHEGHRLEAAAQAPAVVARSAQSRFLAARQHLPPRFLGLGPADPPFPVHYSSQLEKLSDQLRLKFAGLSSTKHAGAAGSAVSPQTVFWEVDVQRDFMSPDGKLYIPGAEAIIPNVQRLIEVVRRGQVFLISEVDAHLMDDPELSEWPPHCLKGTPGAELIPEGCAATRLVVPNQKGYVFPKDLSQYQQIVLEKNTLNVFDNPNTDILLGQIGPQGLPMLDRDAEFVVFGVVTEYCVRCTVEGLLDRGRRVAVVIDAIQPLDPGKGQRVLVDAQARGARIVTTAEALALVTPALVKSA